MKVCVLIADIDDPFFQSVIDDCHERIWHPFISEGIPVFYVRGITRSPIETRLEQMHENLRWSRFAFLQKYFDKVFMKKYLNRDPVVRKSGNMINCEYPEGLRFLSFKIVHAMKFLVDEGYTHIYRTTISSVVNFDLFINYLDVVGSTPIIYAGSVGSFRGVDFVSGSNLLMNGRAVQFLYSNRRALDTTVLDDVAFGKILKGKILNLAIKSRTISSDKDFQQLTVEDRKSIVHYRCKSSSVPRNDQSLINMVSSFISGN